MIRRGEQNEVDLGRIVDEINAIYAKGGIDFVFLPGDIADDGSRQAYEAVRSHLDHLQLPWCGIVGDHDVHEKSFRNFQNYIGKDLYSAFTVGPYRFFRMNAFSAPNPDSFTLDDEQLRWLESELQQCVNSGQRAVLLLHCYPSDLRHGGEELKRMLLRYPVLLIDMGHTHYNELSNDGAVLYSATRSTGQIEEGPVGYSITTLDNDTVSWHFISPGSPSTIAITQPADERLVTKRSGKVFGREKIPLHVKVWSRSRVLEVNASADHMKVKLSSEDGLFWTGVLDASSFAEGDHELRFVAKAEQEATSSIRLRIGATLERTFAEADQENSIGAWAERGLLDTKLGPNKNGKKW